MVQKKRELYKKVKYRLVMETGKKYFLTTLWSQDGKVVGCGSNETLENGINFNQYTPWDLYFSEKVQAYTGCAITAVAQVFYYYLQNDYLDDEISYDIKLDVLTEQDSYVCYANIPALTVYVSADGSGDGEGGMISFEEIGQKLTEFVPVPPDPESGDYDLNSLAAADYIAALNFTIGVLHKAEYSNIFETGAVFSESVFLRCGFKSAMFVSVGDFEASEQSLWITDDTQVTDEAIEIFIENLEKGAPIAFGIPGHGVVLDGYDEETDMFHLNYGWGPESAGEDDSAQGDIFTRWYTRDEFKKLETIGFVLDISPVYQEVFTVTDSRVFGSGTFYRALQQAEAMQGANVIEFDDALADSDALELSLILDFKDQITVSGFNLTVFSHEENNSEDSAEAENAAESDEENTEKAVVVVFNGESGNRTDFTDFRGRMISRFTENADGAVFDFSEAVQLSISTSNACIFAGVSQLENAAVLDYMVSGSLDELLDSSQIKGAIAGSDGDDRIVLDEETLVIGNFELSAGHDSLTVAGNSQVYGDIDVGSGDNKITIAAGATLHGNLQGEAELFFTLGGSDSSVLFDITGDAGSTFQNIAFVTIDATQAEAEEYILFNTGDIEVLMEKLQIKGDGGLIVAEDGSIRWSAAEGDVPVVEEEEKNGETNVSAGETVTDAEVGANEILIFHSGSCATGSLSIAEEGEVKVMTGAEFVFDISSMSEENESGIIDNYSGINGTFHFSVNVAADQACGSYILAGNVEEWSFNTPISVTAGELKLGTFGSGKDESGFTYGDEYYSLVYDENNKSLSLVIESAFRLTVNEDNSIKLAWHKPAGAGGYFLNISRSDESGVMEIFSVENSLNIVTAADGEYEWKVMAPVLDSEYREGGTFSVGDAQETSPDDTAAAGAGSLLDSDGEDQESSPEDTAAAETGSTLYSAGETDAVTDVFMAVSSGTWKVGYFAQHSELPEGGAGINSVCTRVALAGKQRYTDIFNGAAGDASLLYLSDAENGDALFIDDVFSAFPDQNQCERLANISRIYAGEGNDIVDLTTSKFKFSGEDIRVFGGAGNDVIWAGSESACCLYGDEGNDSLIGSTQDDCLIGGAGDDVMHGGGGNDLFAYGDPSTWGNDIIYQLRGENNVAELYFAQKELEDRITVEQFEGGVRLTVEGCENSSITFYGQFYSLSFGGDCAKLKSVVEDGGLGEYASQKIFEDNKDGMLA